MGKIKADIREMIKKLCEYRNIEVVAISAHDWSSDFKTLNIGFGKGDSIAGFKVIYNPLLIIRIV